ncbi:uncharacterized protein LOC121247196 [Juglans microcarpa x Juglans regia]|uniref:uncharacterized protein LOC121247196 n=1 Tax=Juglans microcarpa x Juglans regia TaxID=2249226 RepID=UPI001B7F4BC6|nr:uncharacterized protein LOC121247196 [Juglans microcarpa x Juglans regia]
MPVKVIVDELSLIDAPVSDDDLTLYVFNGLGSEFRDMVAHIRTRETALSFAELHDLLIGHEQYLKRMDGNNSTLVVTANSSQRKPFNRRLVTLQGIVRKCNLTLLLTVPLLRLHRMANGWLCDSAASHNITSDLANLSIHSDYDRQDEVVLGDGIGFQVANIGSTTISSISRSLPLNETLHDRMTEAVLMRGRCEGGVYPMELCSPQPQAHAVNLAGTLASFDC